MSAGSSHSLSLPRVYAIWMMYAFGYRYLGMRLVGSTYFQVSVALYKWWLSLSFLLTIKYLLFVKEGLFNA